MRRDRGKDGERFTAVLALWPFRSKWTLVRERHEHAEDGKKHLLAAKTVVYRKIARKMRRDGEREAE